jgi:23S rRNA pseudouridine2605 synthase
MKPQGNSTWLRITLAEGRNREIRRMLAKFGHKVMRLKRVAIGPILLDRLPKGKLPEKIPK